MSREIEFSIFTKPWKTKEAGELAEMVRTMGFGGVEFPLREGYQAQPGDASESLPRLARVFAGCGLKIYSVASEPTEEVFSGCAEAGVPLIRIMHVNDLATDYLASEDAMRKTIEGLLPLCEKYGVKIGLQQHFGPGLNNSMEMRHMLEPFDPKWVGGIWDAAHSGLAGEEPEQAIDVIWEYLLLANFKNAYYRRTSGPQAIDARFTQYFTTGRQGLCSWRRALARLHQKGYTGNICLPAEYTDEPNTEAYVAMDIAYIKALVDEIYGPGKY